MGIPVLGKITFLLEIKSRSCARCMAALVWPNSRKGERLSEYFLLAHNYIF